MEQRDLPAARLVPRALLGHVRAAAAGTGAWLRAQWRRVEPQALALALTAVAVFAVLAVTVAIAESALSASAAPNRPVVIYLVHAPPAPPPAVAEGGMLLDCALPPVQ